MCLQLEAVLARATDWQFDSFELAAASGNRPLSVLAFYLIKRETNLVKKVHRQGLGEGAYCRTDADVSRQAAQLISAWGCAVWIALSRFPAQSVMRTAWLGVYQPSAV